MAMALLLSKMPMQRLRLQFHACEARSLRNRRRAAEGLHPSHQPSQNGYEVTVFYPLQLLH